MEKSVSNGTTSAELPTVLSTPTYTFILKLFEALFGFWLSYQATKLLIFAILLYFIEAINCHTYLQNKNDVAFTAENTKSIY